MANPNILVIAEDFSLQNDLSTMLTKHGYAPAAVEGGLKRIADIEIDGYDVVLCNVERVRSEIFDLLDTVQEDAPDTPVIVITAHAETEALVAILKHGAFDYITKPFDLEELLLSIQRAVEWRRLIQEHRMFKREARIQCDCSMLVGISPAIREICQTIGKIAQTDSPVLIYGESGTGKELVARAIHANSARCDRPRVTLNCGAIPPNLIENELFGHVKGAYTGAVDTKRGLFEEVDGGTLFLDEIGELDIDLQVKLLRVLEDKEIRRIGDNHSRRIDVRIVAATNRPLEEMVEQHRFRSDLYYRLNVLRINIPPLRERREDILVLADFFLRKYREKYQKPIHGLTPAVRRILMEQKWSGNVRELEHTIERAVVMCDGDILAPCDLPFETPDTEFDAMVQVTIPEDQVELSHAITEATRSIERQLIGRALKATGGNRSHACRLLGISRRALLYKLKKYGLDPLSACERN